MWYYVLVLSFLLSSLSCPASIAAGKRQRVFQSLHDEGEPSNRGNSISPDLIASEDSSKESENNTNNDPVNRKKAKENQPIREIVNIYTQMLFEENSAIEMPQVIEDVNLYLPEMISEATNTFMIKERQLRTWVAKAITAEKKNRKRAEEEKQEPVTKYMVMKDVFSRYIKNFINVKPQISRYEQAKTASQEILEDLKKAFSQEKERQVIHNAFDKCLLKRTIKETDSRTPARNYYDLKNADTWLIKEIKMNIIKKMRDNRKNPNSSTPLSPGHPSVNLTKDQPLSGGIVDAIVINTTDSSSTNPDSSTWHLSDSEEGAIVISTTTSSSVNSCIPRGEDQSGIRPNPIFLSTSSSSSVNPYISRGVNKSAVQLVLSDLDEDGNISSDNTSNSGEKRKASNSSDDIEDHSRNQKIQKLDEGIEQRKTLIMTLLQDIEKAKKEISELEEEKLKLENNKN